MFKMNDAEDVMEMIDLVFEQIRKDSHSKKIADAMSCRIKHILAHAMPDDCEEIDLPGDQLIDMISMIRSGVKPPKVIEGNYQILKEMLKYQKRFYIQSNDFNVDVLRTYSKYIKNCEEMYNCIRDELSKLDKLEFKYKVDLALPLAVSVKNIEEYCDSLKIAVKSLYKIVIAEGAKDCIGLGPFLVFHEELYGDEKLGNETLTYWFACYEAYVRYHVKGEKKVDIVKALDESPLASLYSFNLKGDVSNASAKLTAYIDEAERLIASAERGAFPY
jgi:hypothetical protein